MPRGNGTGPRNEGPQTGRNAGFCAGNEAAGFANRNAGGWGRGRRRNIGPGLGLARGFRGRHPRVDLYGFKAFNGEINPDTEGRVLRHRAEMLRDELKALDDRIGKMDRNPEEVPDDPSDQ